jgi:hypothetical protein
MTFVQVHLKAACVLKVGIVPRAKRHLHLAFVHLKTLALKGSYSLTIKKSMSVKAANLARRQRASSLFHEKENAWDVTPTQVLTWSAYFVGVVVTLHIISLLLF